MSTLLRTIGWPFKPLVMRTVTQSQFRMLHEDEHTGIISAPSPFERPKAKCILCEYKIDLDYKNTRLLSQFLSPFTGEIYDKHITGLCEKQQTILEKEVKKSRQALLMPWIYKKPKFNKDPPLFNPDKPRRANPY